MRHNSAEDFARFIVEKGEWLRNTAYRLCEDWHEADDLVQTTLFKLLRQEATGPNRLSAAYIRRMLFTTYIDERRRWRWGHEVCIADPPEIQCNDPDIAGRVDVRNAVQQLEAYDRAVIILRFWCDLSTTQTAAVLSTSSSEISDRTRRALRTLRRALVSVSPT